MSEYQYYEFQAIDRPLTEKEMRELRSCSSRALITPTSFVNDYQWGNFKGDEDGWMEKYFDAFLYLANWGTRVFKLRLPARLLDVKTARRYCIGQNAAVKERDGKILMTLQSNDEGGEWVEGEGTLSSLISVRAELARGDLRGLYLGWLLCAQNGDLDDDDVEPPIPSGLARLSASLENLADFLRIDSNLIRVAAQASPPTEEKALKPSEIRALVARLPAADKDDLLARFIVGENGVLASELLQRFTRDNGRSDDPTVPSKKRTVRQLLRKAERAAEEQRRVQAKKAAIERAQREQASAIARERHLDAIAGRESMLWEQVESLIATKQPKKYDFAMQLLVDLRDLAARKDSAKFRRRLQALRAQHVRKPTLIERLRRAGL